MRAFRLLPVFLLAGCGSPDADIPPAPVVRDSAGVTIVDNGPDVGDAVWARLRVRPDLEIGAANAGTGVQFGQIVDVAVDGAGRLYVLDQVSRSVRVFDGAGAEVRTIGRAGDGPGELSRYVNALMLRADTLLIADWASRRMNRFAPDGTLLGVEELGTSGGRSWWQVAPDGSLRARVLRTQVDPAGRWAFEDALVAVHAGSPPDTLLRFDYVATDVGGPQQVRAPLIINAPSWTVLPDGGIAWTALDLSEVRVHGPDGRRVRVIRRDGWVARTATDADRAHMVRLLRERLERLGGDPSAIGRLDIPPVGSLPVLTSVLAGPRGTLWVQRAGEPARYHSMSINASEFPHGLGGPDWDVFDETGRFLATVSLPGTIQVVRIAADALYGVHRDALGVESVVRLRLEGVPR